MRLLIFDHNLSPKLANRLDDLFPDSIHVDTIGLGAASDIAVWDYARTNDFIIVTKDADFSELIVVHGFPPKVIWIRRGNCSTNDIEELMRVSFEDIVVLNDEESTAILTLF